MQQQGGEHGGSRGANKSLPKVRKIREISNGVASFAGVHVAKANPVSARSASSTPGRLLLPTRFLFFLALTHLVTQAVTNVFTTASPLSLPESTCSARRISEGNDPCCNAAAYCLSAWECGPDSAETFLDDTHENRDSTNAAAGPSM